MFCRSCGRNYSEQVRHLAPNELRIIAFASWVRGKLHHHQLPPQRFHKPAILISRSHPHRPSSSISDRQRPANRCDTALPPSGAMSPTLREPINSLAKIYTQYSASSGLTEGSSTGLTSRRFFDLCHDCSLAENAVSSVAILHMSFMRAARSSSGSAEPAHAMAHSADWGEKKINFSQFLLALDYMAASRGVPPEVLHERIVRKARNSGSPHGARTRSAPPSNVNGVGVYDGRRLYTALSRNHSGSPHNRRTWNVGQTLQS